MRDREIWTYGGVGGIGAATEDLEHAVGMLRWAAALLDDAARAAGMAAVLAAVRPGSTPVSVAPAHAAARLHGDVEAAAQGLVAAVQAYADAEAAALHSVYGTALAERAQDALGTAAWGGRWALLAGLFTVPVGSPLLRRDLALAIIPEPLPPTTAWVNEPSVHGTLNRLGPLYDQLVDVLAAGVGTLELFEDKVDAVAAGPPVQGTHAAGLEQTMHRLWDVEQLNDGSVAIETAVTADGSRVHTVYIPGTQDWLVSSSNPFDAHANLDAIGGQMTDSGLTVLRAMESHGIAPGERVMLAGHSQGGMVAHAVAAAVAQAAPRRFRITEVVTAGSPTGRLALPGGVRGLHLENTRDLVPGLDGARNPDTVAQVTVVHDRREDPFASDPSETVAQAHHLNGYADTARHVDRGLSPSSNAWRSRASPFFEPGTATSTVYRPVVTPAGATSVSPAGPPG